MILGLDTSNYTTSAAVVDASGIRKDVRRPLSVAEGALGLRQSDALFQHVKQLPVILEELFYDLPRGEVRAVAASTKPREVEGSYMPCFLAGESCGRSLAAALGVPFYAFSHQQGHIAAVLADAGRLELIRSSFLAWHLSGGTTELLLVEPAGKLFSAHRIGGTSDISAGQLIDRTGQHLKLPFPSGKALDELSQKAEEQPFFRVKTEALSFSFSGLENKMHELSDRGAPPETVAAFVLRSIAEAVKRTTAEAKKLYPDAAVVFSGGVSSNRLLRDVCAGFGPVFSAPALSTDNAVGTATLARLQEG